jgi:Tol biopolymer transport system component
MKRFWYYILALIIVAILAGLFDQKVVSIASLNNLQRKITNPIKDKLKNGSLIFISVDKKFQILELKPDNSEKILFTDIDEKFKISKFTNETINGKIALFTNENKLITVDFANIGRVTNISETAPISTEFALSPDSQTYAFVRFSNAERDFGYSLNLMDVKTSTVKELFKDDLSIENLKWIDQQTIMFIKDNNDVASYNILKNEEINIFTAKKEDVIFDFGLNSDMMLLSQGSILETGSSVYKMDKDGKNINKIYTEKSGTIYDPTLSPDGKNIAYILSPEVSSNYKGYIYTIDMTGKDKQKLEQANKIILWNP